MNDWVGAMVFCLSNFLDELHQLDVDVLASASLRNKC